MKGKQFTIDFYFPLSRRNLVKKKSKQSIRTNQYVKLNRSYKNKRKNKLQPNSFFFLFRLPYIKIDIYFHKGRDKTRDYVPIYIVNRTLFMNTSFQKKIINLIHIFSNSRWITFFIVGGSNYFKIQTHFHEDAQKLRFILICDSHCISIRKC